MSTTPLVMQKTAAEESETPFQDVIAEEARPLARLDVRSLHNLDLLRALAVGLVFFDHMNLALGQQWILSMPVHWMGQLGVCLFFVHTSLVLMWSLERRPHIAEFLIRRAFRIYPLALVAVAIAVATHAPVAGPPDHWFEYHRLDWKTILSQAALVQNLAHTRIVVNCMWSLSLEVQMYLVLPVLFFAIRNEKRKWLIPTLWLGFACLSYFRYPPTSLPLPVVFPLFLSGVLSYRAFASWKADLPGWVFPLALAAVFAAFMQRPNSHSAWLAALAVGLMLPKFRQIKNASAIKASHVVAKYSYGLYLLQPFCLVLGVYLLPHAPVFLQIAISIITTAAASYAAYHLVEQPMMDLGASVGARTRPAESLPTLPPQAAELAT